MRRRAQWQNLKYLRQGRRQAYEAVISQHYKSIYRFLAYLTEDISLAEDLTQDTFVAAWENIYSFKARASMSTWLHKIAYHKFIDSKRRFERNVGLLDRLREEKNYVQQSSNPLQELIADEYTRNLYIAVHKSEPVVIFILRKDCYFIRETTMHPIG